MYQADRTRVAQKVSVGIPHPSRAAPVIEMRQPAFASADNREPDGTGASPSSCCARAAGSLGRIESRGTRAFRELSLSARCSRLMNPLGECPYSRAEALTDRLGERPVASPTRKRGARVRCGPSCGHSGTNREAPPTPGREGRSRAARGVAPCVTVARRSRTVRRRSACRRSSGRSRASRGRSMGPSARARCSG